MSLRDFFGTTTNLDTPDQKEETSKSAENNDLDSDKTRK